MNVVANARIKTKQVWCFLPKHHNSLVSTGQDDVHAILYDQFSKCCFTYVLSKVNCSHIMSDVVFAHASGKKKWFWF